MKTKNGMLVMFMMVISTMVFAQHHGGKEKGQHDTGAYLKKVLSLSDDQVKKIDAINTDFSARFKKLRSDSTVNREAARADMKKLKDERTAQMKGVLSADQFKKWTALKEKHGDGKRGKGMDADRMKKELALNDDQSSKVDAINKKYADRYKSLKGDSTNRESSRAEIKKIREEKNAELKTVLTPEQYSKLEALRSQHHHKKGSHKGENSKG